MEETDNARALELVCALRKKDNAAYDNFLAILEQFGYKLIVTVIKNNYKGDTVASTVNDNKFSF